MKRKLLSILTLLAFSLPLTCLADNIGNCGWGAKLFDGQSGVAPQVLAATTNGTSGNQTFGISSGTSGCTQNGTVKTNWRTAAYIDANMNRLARDMSRGEGESLDSLAQLMQVQPKHRVALNQTLQKNFSSIFPQENVPSDEVMNSMREVMSADEQLSSYATALS